MSGASNEPPPGAGPGGAPPGGIPEELHILAGEYALGVLDGQDARAVRRRAAQDAQLAAAIAAWERRLAPLAELAPPAAPPPALWDRLERAIAELPAEPADEAPTPDARAPDARSSDARSSDARSSDATGGPRRAPGLRVPPPEAGLPRPGATVAPLVPRRRGPMPPPRRVWPWQMATVASLALAAGLAAIAFVPEVALRLNLSPPPPQFAALMRPDSQAEGFLAEARGDGQVVLTALAPVPAPSGHDLELWILRPGAAAPASLGVLPAGGRRVTLPGQPPSGTLLLVSVEPQGGSPTGAPTGPVVYKGALAQLSL